MTIGSRFGLCIVSIVAVAVAACRPPSDSSGQAQGASTGSAATAATTAAPADTGKTADKGKDDKSDKKSKGSDDSKGSSDDSDPAPPKNVSAGYRWEVHNATGMEFEVPNDWTKQVQGDVMVISSPVPGAAIEFVGASGGATAKTDEKAVLGTIGRTFQAAHFTSPVKPVEQHGLRGFVATGAGRKNGNEVEWLVSGLGDGHGHELLANAFWKPGVSGAIRQQMIHVLDSIQSANH